MKNVIKRYPLRLIKIGFLSVLFFMFLVSYAEKPAITGSPVAVKSYNVKLADNKSEVSYPAKVRSKRKVDLSFQVSGPLIELNVREGQKVAKGDLLARIDPTDYENNLLAAKARYTEASLSYERLKKLTNKKVVTQAKLDQAKSVLDVTKASLLIAEKALKDTYLYAPFDGQISKRHLEKYSFVPARRAVITIQDITNVEFVIQVQEAVMIRGIENFSKDAEVYLDAIPEKRFKLGLSEFSTEPDPYTQTYSVVFSMPNPKDISLYSGMTATVVIKNKSMISSYQIPVSASFSDYSGGKFVWKIDRSQVVKKQQIEVSAISGSNILVSSGIDVGDQIVESGVHRLREGDVVKSLN